jgi:hypothetical protein
LGLVADAARCLLAKKKQVLRLCFTAFRFAQDDKFIFLASSVFATRLIATRFLAIRNLATRFLADRFSTDRTLADRFSADRMFADAFQLAGLKLTAS